MVRDIEFEVLESLIVFLFVNVFFIDISDEIILIKKLEG